MIPRWILATLMLTGVTSAVAQTPATTLAEQRQQLFVELQQEQGLSDAQMSRIRAIFAGSRIIGQGNPAITRHPMTREECRVRVKQSGAIYANPTFERICGTK